MKAFRHFALVVYCLTALAIVAHSLPQKVNNAREKNKSQPAEESQASDALGRDTPNGTVFGFLEAARNGRYQDASEYLQMSRDARARNGAHIARQLYVLMDSAFVERVGVLSSHTEGSHQIGVPKDRERIGVFRINDNDTSVDLVHVSDPTSGNIWLFSSQVVTDVPELFTQVEGGEAELGRSHLQVIRNVLNTVPRRVIAMLALIPLCLALGWMFVFALGALLRIFARWRHYAFSRQVLKAVTAPISLILAAILHLSVVYFLGIPLLTRLQYQKLIGVVLVLGVAWLVSRVISVWSDRARKRYLDSTDHRGGSIILLSQRMVKVLVFIVAGLLTVSMLGFDVTTAIAGLGIGSIALAFAAQKTLENLLGGVSILGDQVIRIGEWCKFGDREGIVEDISLRSTRIRTLEYTLLSVPNGQLANMSLENITRRTASLFRTTIGLRQETSPDQLRTLLMKLTSIFQHDPMVDSETIRVHLTGFSEGSIDVGIFCRILTGNLETFLTVREALLLRIMEAVSEAGTALAIPSYVVLMPETRDRELSRKPLNAADKQRYRAS